MNDRREGDNTINEEAKDNVNKGKQKTMKMSNRKMSRRNEANRERKIV